jgi:transcriptional regulator with XRE-family HTH domain
MMQCKGYPLVPRSLGQHIRKRRLELGLTQKQVARILGVSQPSVQHWEDYERMPMTKRVPQIIKFLGYDPRR